MNTRPISSSQLRDMVRIAFDTPMSAAKKDKPSGGRLAQLFTLRGTSTTQKLSLLAGGASTGGAYAVDSGASHSMLVGGLAVLAGLLVARLIRWFVGWLITVVVVVIGLILGLSALGWLPDSWTSGEIAETVAQWWSGATAGISEAASELLPGSGGGGVGLFAGLTRQKKPSGEG